jgi:hypothetical protein
MSTSHGADLEPRHRELMLRVARQPRFCCGCFCLSPADRARAQRVFAIVRRLMATRAKALRAQAVSKPTTVITKP